MSESHIRLILLEIESLREHLQKLIEERETLQDNEIQTASQRLDAALNDYVRLLHQARRD
ncbi:MAG: aspartyl-phosphate phosphatase Spo0E family protein [Candidatus Desulforudis sp.]|nr:aspartyl-phosphate phosphatase Spo0E family protein [Desulforudis sp.]